MSVQHDTGEKMIQQTLKHPMAVTTQMAPDLSDQGDSSIVMYKHRTGHMYL